MSHHRKWDCQLRNPAIIGVAYAGFPVSSPRDIPGGAAFKTIHLRANRIYGKDRHPAVEMLAVYHYRYMVIAPDSLTTALSFTLTLFLWLLIVAVEGNIQRLAIGCNPCIRLFHYRRIAGEAIKGFDAKCTAPSRVIEVTIDDRWC
jgi:hypothetical protein